MNLNPSDFPFRQIALRSARVLAALAVALAATLICQPATAVDTLAYDFNSSLQGWISNPQTIGTVPSLDTTGKVNGTNSMRVDVDPNGTFEGILCPDTDMPPFLLTPPSSPAIDHLHFDMFIPARFPDGYLDMGVVVFGHTNPGNPLGDKDGQIQFFGGLAQVAGKDPGTYFDQRIDLQHGSSGDFGIADGKYSDLIGTGPNQITPYSFELYINKDGSNPFTLYIDNIRFGSKVVGDYSLNDVVDAADYTVWRDSLGAIGATRPANGDNNPPSNNVVDIADYNFWKARFGNVSGSGGLGQGGGVPEPGTAVLALVAAVGGLVAKRKFLVSGI